MQKLSFSKKGLRAFVGIFLMILAFKNSSAQFISYPVPAQSLTIGLDSTALTVQISFPVCTDVKITINLGAINAPGLIEYIPGSITKLSGAGTIIESDITDLRNPVFSIGNTSFGQTIVFSVRRRVSCGTASSSKDNVIVNGTNCSFSETNTSINTYSLLSPVFTITTSTQLVNAEVGNSYNRNIKIVNGGNGCADKIGFWIKYPTGSMQLNSLNVGSTMLTALFSNGDSSYFELSGSILGATNKLCNGESINLIENVKILKCNSLTNYGANGFDFGNNICQTTLAVSGISMSNTVPNLTVSLAPNLLTSCFTSVPRAFNYTIKNIGAGPAANIVINTGNHFNNAARANTYGYIDTAGLMLKFPGMPAFHPDASYYAATTLIEGLASDNNLACNEGKIAHIQFSLPATFILSAGDSITVSYNVIYCASNNACGTVYSGNPQGTQVLYKNACGNSNYTTGNYVGTTSFPYNTPSISTFEFPSQVRGGDCYDVTISTNPVPTNNISVRGYIEYEISIPAGASFSAANMIGVVATPHAGYPRIVGNKVITRYNVTTGGNPIKFIFCTPNNLCTSSSVDAVVTVSPDSACVIVQPANNNSVKRCSSSPINFVCTTPCPTGGILPTYWSYGRKNFGEPDKNFNKLPDGTGIVDQNIVYKNRYRAGDTLHSEFRSYLLEQTAPASITNWNHVNANWNFSKHIWAPAGTATVTIKRGAAITVVPNVTIATTTYGKIFNVDFSQAPVALAGLAPFQVNDSIIVEADFILKDSLISTSSYSPHMTAVDDGTRGKSYADVPDVVLLTNAVYASTMANPAALDRATCFVPSYNANTLHLFNFSLLYGSDLSGCIASKQEIRGYTRKLGGYSANYFPGEYRQEFIPDSLILYFPQGMTVSPGSQSVSGLYINSHPGFTSVSNTAILPYVSISGNSLTGTTVVLDTKTALALNPSWRIQSEGTFYTFGMDAKGSCATPNSFSINGRQTGHLYQWPTAANQAVFNNPAKAQTNSTFINTNKPTVNLSSPDASNAPSSDTTCWSIVLQNSSSQTAPINFVRITNSPSFNNYVVKNGNTILIPNTDGLYQVGSIAAGATVILNICVNTNNCILDSIKVESGWDCDTYPTGASLANYSCWKSVWLKAVPLLSQIQLSVDKQPLSPSIALCTTDTMIFKINSALANFADNPEFRVTVPTGMVINSGEIEYPDGSGNWEMVTAVNLSATLVYKIEAHSAVNIAGLPGTLNSPGAAYRAARLRLSYSTTCDFVSGSKLSVQQRADRPCGLAISNNLGFNNIVRANPIYITGAGGIGIVGIDVSLSPTTITCGTTTVSGRLTPSGSATTTSDTIIVTLPSGIGFAGNFLSVDGITIAAGYPVTGNGGSQILKLKVPDAIQSGNTIIYSFDVNTTAVNFGCGSLNIQSDVERTFAPLTCGTMVCPSSSKSIIGSADGIVTVEKPDLTITGFEYSSGDFSSGGTATVELTISNSGNVAAAAASYIIEFFCGSSTTPFTTSIFPAAIPVSASATASVVIAIPASPVCDNGQIVTAVVRPLTAANQAQCLCQQTNRPMLRALFVSLSYFNARQNNCNIVLDWHSLTELNLKQFEVEFSTNGSTFSKVGIVNGKGDNSSYSFTHQPTQGRVFYRLHMIDRNGESKYSSIIVMNANCNGKNVLVYPNPASEILNVNLSGFSGVVNGRLFNNIGQLVYTRQLQTGTNTIETNKLPTGTYTLIVSELKGVQQYYKIQITH